ncbi:MAG: nicotinamide riboside transporter PnuC [Bacteroidales bacterium]|jgi:nicotinamide mononucleotide transporter|nr:nicotinamide riboside transporter PnuC [Bacteroidales bacterium]MDD3665471.1 nicotinamide riboside transporter PnuC [Bacteroidales bacterium]
MNDFISGLMSGIANTTPLEYIAVFTGILSVWYCRRENILVFPTGLVNVMIYVYLFFKAGMYANMGINAVFFITSIYGWYNWSRGSSDEKLIVTTLHGSKIWIFAMTTILISIILYFILTRFTNSPAPLMDSITTAIFITAMWLQAIKKRETWLLWIAGDVLMIPLSIVMGLHFTAVQYLAFLGLAVSGWIEWTKSYKTNLAK